MIEISGSVRRSFSFPADLPLAYAYYCDVERLLTYLPHICMVRTFGSRQFRMLYDTVELGVYHIRIFWDVDTVLDGGRVIHVRPLAGSRPVGPAAGLYSSTAQGHFHSESVFRAAEAGQAETRIDYRLQLEARLPVPLAARFMPAVVLDRIGNSIMHIRMRDIADGFIQRSIDAFPHWLGELEQGKRPIAPGPAGRHPS